MNTSKILSRLTLPLIVAVFQATSPALLAEEKTPAESQTSTIELDSNRGDILLPAANGTYEEKNHFAYWNWDFETQRPGSYEVRVIYTSVRQKKMGLQFRLDDTTVLKAYVYRSRKPDAADEYVLGRAQIPAKGKHHISLLTADKSKIPPFSIKAIRLVPTQESKTQLGQSLDGTVELHAGDAITHSEKMHYEAAEKKNCLGRWVNKEDWAEWNFHISMPGKFKVTLEYGCGDKSGGSEVAVITSNHQVLKFKVKETGGFQNWQSIDIGTIELGNEGAHQLALQPLSKPGKAVMDVRKVTLTPLK